VKTNRTAKRLLFTFFVASTVLLALPRDTRAQQSDKNTDKNEVIKKARQTYYNLKSEGLTEFRCSMTPDWEYILKEARKNDAESIDLAVKKLQALHFSLTLGLDGNAQVLHNEITAENDQVASGLRQIYSGMTQMATGFFQTWSGYMIQTALPEVGSDFQLVESDSEYRISYKDGAADVTTLMAKDFTITSQAVRGKDFDATLKPKFNKIAKGLVLASYQATYHGATPAEETLLDVGINYQDVNALQFPSEITLNGSYAGTPFSAKVSFFDCQATKTFKDPM